MYEVKTKPQDVDVREYLRGIQPPKRAEEGLRLLEIFEQETGEKGVLWGDSMLGFGTYHYKPKSGAEADWFRVGFAPRKAKLVFYLYAGAGREALLARLGKHTVSHSCIYVNKLSDMDEVVLRELIRASWEKMGRHYPE